MSDKIKATTNKVVLNGLVAEFKSIQGTTKKGVPYITVKGAIQFGDKVMTKRFEKFQQAYKTDEKGNKVKDYANYDKFVKFAETVKALADEGVTEETATKVNLQGSFETNDYVSVEEKLIESLIVSPSFFNDFNGELCGTADIEGYIQAITPETKGEDAVETGRLKVTLLTTDFFGNIIPIKNLIIPAELRSDFESAYEVGQTALFYADFKANKSEGKPKKQGGLGVKRVTEGKSFVELVVSGAESPLDEDMEGAISREAVKIALNERKARLDELKEAGYQGTKSPNGENRSGLGSAKDKFVTPVSDEELPF